MHVSSVSLLVFLKASAIQNTVAHSISFGTSVTFRTEKFQFQRKLPGIIYCICSHSEEVQNLGVVGVGIGLL